MLNKKILGSLFVFISFLSFFNFQDAKAQTEIVNDIDFYYSTTCTNCAKEKVFLNELQKKYPDLEINYIEVTGNQENRQKWQEHAKQVGADKYFGLVPMTIVGNQYVVGFNDNETTGKKVEELILGQGDSSADTTVVCEEDEYGTELCIPADPKGVEKVDFNQLNEISGISVLGLNLNQISLPFLSALLGFFDGFNVCSLGALLLILSLVLTMKSRKKVVLFGGLFLIITGITYAILIYFWYALFSIITPYVAIFEYFIIGIGLIGGIYFFKQYLRFRKFGPNCEISNSPFINKIVAKVQDTFKFNKNIWTLLGAVILFAFILTVIEFPCSAVIPVAFSAILVESGISGFAYLGYLAIFMFFYLIDEIIVFAIGAWSMRLWTASPKMTTNLVLVQSIVFIVLAVFYLVRLF